MLKYTFFFFWMDANRKADGIAVNIETEYDLTIGDIHENAEKIFIQAMRGKGYNDKVIDSIDYQLAVQKGWCGNDIE